MRLPRVLRTTSFRFAAIYVLLFVASAFVLGTVVFFVARQAMLRQMTVRIDAEVALLETEYRQKGLAGLIAIVESRERGGAAPFDLSHRGQRGFLRLLAVTATYRTGKIRAHRGSGNMVAGKQHATNLRSRREESVS